MKADDRAWMPHAQGCCKNPRKLKKFLKKYTTIIMIVASAVILNVVFDLAVTRDVPQSRNFEESNTEKMQLGNEKIVTRKDWGARPPKEKTPLRTPVNYVVIHHSFIPPMCTTRDQCSYAMRTVQSMHVDQNKWADIGYNFGIGSDGVVYEGRGWSLRGAHALHFNGVSLGICVIGNWNDTLPPDIQLQATKDLINTGIALGFISENYKLVGHRQVRDTECPGQTFFEEIQQWPHFAPGNHSENSVEID